MAEEKKTFEEWDIGTAPLNYSPTDVKIPRYLAEVIAESAIREESEIVQSYPWILRPVVRWLRVATRP
ncbi:hypothetical protein [Ensifer adhaerens]|uniref:hypothetical protein n=1 Tax=Ensifer adhaerens TaxID=106592 RepID=UPI000DC2B57A|nr:hypothetical protein [Ensifer adhaerens]RAS16112.1 hypothetical protein DEU52_10242 [Ensifer adhaerens]